MAFADRLIHEIVVIRTDLDDEVSARDDYGQPTVIDTVRTEVRGLVQPLGAREVAATHDAGTEITDHRIFMAPMDLLASDAIEYGGRLYEIQGIRRFEFGSSPHLEVDARLVGRTNATEPEAS